jgi:signal peptidase II
MRALRAAAVVALLLAVDRASKLWALGTLRSVGSIQVLPFFELTYIENTGAAFGLGRGANGAFICVSAVLIVALVNLLRRWPKDAFFLQAGGTLVLAGALGNLYDRLAYRYVVDFLFVHHFPWVFNVADSCITVGACLLAWGLKDEKPAAA